MYKVLVTICLVIAVGLVLTGCEFNPATSLSKLGTHDAETNVDIPEDGKFFELERTGEANDLKEFVEVSYDGKIKFNSGKATEKVKEATRDEVVNMYDLIKAKDFNGLKEELKLEGTGDPEVQEKLTLFDQEGREEIFNITAEDLTTGEDTVLPDKWDVYLTKFRRFLGALTGETDN